MEINKFREEHKEFLDMLLDDTWLRDEPIDVEEVIACWEWALHVKEESVSIDNFKDKFGLSFEDITDWWNKDILKVYDKAGSDR